MFAIDEATTEAIRAIFAQESEWSAAVELRRRFPLIIDNAQARASARTIAGWTPLPTRRADAGWGGQLVLSHQTQHPASGDAHTAHAQPRPDIAIWWR
jgi:hypothetical protein